MSSDQPLVSIVIPARNEEHDIEGALRSVLDQEFPLDQMEILVVDGASEDATANAVERTLRGSKLASWAIISNPKGRTPSSLNLGLAAAQGSYLCRVDARSRVPADYVSRCIDCLAGRADVAVVGGSQMAQPRSEGALAVGIARALNNRYSMGFSRYRRGASSGPSDTVYLGSFRTDELREVGGWNEAFDTNQDFELNRRMGRRGSVWFDADLEVAYVPRADFMALFRQYQRFGQWKVRYWRQTGDRPQPRQVVLIVAPLAGVAALAVGAAHGPRVLTSAVLTGVLGAFVVEGLGCRKPRGGLLSRTAAVAAMTTTSTAWVLGVVRECAASLVKR